MRSEAPVVRVARAPNRPLVIEFLGTPGSGKTTMATDLIEALRAQGIDAAGIVSGARDHAMRTVPGRSIVRLAPDRLRGPLLWQVFYAYGVLDVAPFAARHPSLVRQVLRSQRTRPISAAMVRHTLFWWLQLAGRSRFLARTAREGEVLVIDDGFLHRVVALFASHAEDVEPDDVDAYVRSIPLPDLAIRPLASRATCERRVRDRGIWRHSTHLSAEGLSHMLAQGERAVDAAADAARRRGCAVAEVPNDETDRADTARRVVEAATALIAASSRAGAGP